MKWVNYYENTKINPYVEVSKGNAKGRSFQTGGSISSSSSRFMVPIGHTDTDNQQS